MNAWYAVWTKPREEARAAENLARQGFHAWLPWVEEPKRKHGHYQPHRAPLFPRYCFVFTDAAQQSLAKVRSSRGCCDVVRVASRPAVVPQAVIDQLRARCDGQGVLHHDTPWQPGQTLEFADGPFAGLKAIFEAATSGDRVRVLLNCLGAWQSTVVSRDSLLMA